jgi:hypothetical protein
LTWRFAIASWPPFPENPGRCGKEANVASLRYSRSVFRILRRLVVGIVLVYTATSLTLGGMAAAKPLFYALAACWSALVSWRGRQQAGTGMSHVVEVILTNVALTLLLGETALRGFAGLAGNSLLVNNTLDAYRLVPGRDYGGGLRGNSLGYPGSDFQRNKRPDVFRIAGLGDSFAVGPTVPFADNYLTVLQTLLPGVEVYNFGVSGTGPREYHAILRRDVWTYSPDLVLVSVFVGNDITEVMATPRHLHPRRHALYLLVDRTWRLAREKERGLTANDGMIAPGQSSFSRETFREVEARRLEICRREVSPGIEKKWQAALGHLDAIAGECRRRQVPVALVLIPDEFQVNPAVLAEARQAAEIGEDELNLPGPQRRLCAFAAARELPCLDLLPNFTGNSDMYAERDTHWNVQGNRLAADHIAAWLRQQKLIPSPSN